MKAETKIKAMYELIENEQLLLKVLVKKIELIERNFAKAETFLITLDSFLSKLKSKLNTSGITN